MERALRFVLGSAPGPDRPMTSSLSIVIDEKTVWPCLGEPEVGVDIYVDDLLSHLTEFWKPLMLRQVYPIGVQPRRPSEIRREAERRWDEEPADFAETEQDAVAAFEEAHDLAHAFGGLYGLPSFWLLREGPRMIVEAAGSVWRLPFADVRTALGAAGDEICARMQRSDADRWRKAIDAWQRRDEGDPVNLLAWSAGLRSETARSLVEQGALAVPRDFDDAANDDDELGILLGR